MDRRAFLKSMVGGVVATAAARSFPFRVYSFPKEIIIPKREILSRWIAADFGFKDPVAVAVYRSPVSGGPYYLVETLTIEEARAKFGAGYWFPTKTSELRGPTEFDVLV